MSSELISSVTSAAAMPQDAAQSGVKSQSGGGKKFEEVLNNGAGAQQTPSAAQQPNAAQSVNAAPKTEKIETLQNNLMQNYEKIGTAQKPVANADLLGELFYNKTRSGLLRDVFSQAGNQSKFPKGGDVMTRFQQVESENKAIEDIMKSNKDLSPGELLGLQARMYQVSQHIEVLSKVVDQVTGGIKTVLNTNV